MNWPPTKEQALKAHDRATRDEYGCVHWVIFPVKRDEVQRPPVVGQTWFERYALRHDAEPEAEGGECFAILRGRHCADLVAVDS